MGELLQGDITEDRAAVAFAGYLNGLEAIARLEPVGIYDESTAGGSEVVHIVARTPGRDKAWYYRLLADGSWNPWIPIDADIEGDPVLPVVWRGRLFVFWLRISKETPVDGSASGVNETSTTKLGNVERRHMGAEASDRSAAQKTAVYATLAFSEYADGEWTPPRSSDPEHPATMGSFPVNGPDQFRRSNYSLFVRYGEDETLHVQVLGSTYGSFLLYTPHGEPEIDPSFPLMLPPQSRHLRVDGHDLKIDYAKNNFAPGYELPADIHTRNVLRGPRDWRAIQTGHHPARPWTSPFLLADRRHVFFVRTRSPSSSLIIRTDIDWWSPSIVLPEFIPWIWVDPGSRSFSDAVDPLVNLGYGVIGRWPVAEPFTPTADLHVMFDSPVPLVVDNVLIGPGGGLARNIER